MRRTIQDILVEWDPDSSGEVVRVVDGDDGRPVLQVRIEMGLLQLELEGRPDGNRPYGYPSLLDYHLDRLEDHRRRYGTVDGYRLGTPECELLRNEAAQYYQRYSSLHQLGRHQDVARDTARNLCALDFLRRHAASSDDSWEMEQYRPYITMMNALSRAETSVEGYDYASAERVLVTAMATIRAFAAQHVGEVEVARELDMLGQRLRGVQRQRPKSEQDLLRRQLEAAVAKEDYETAARLRDRLATLTQGI